MLASILNTTEIIIALVLIFIVLIQNKNVTLNLTSMSGGMGTITKRGPEKILQNATILMGASFIINSILLFIIA